MRNCSAIIQALYCAIGLCSSILLGVCVLMISAYMPVPDALYRRYGEEVSFHVTSKRQMLIENQLPLGVVADSIAHLRQEDCAIWDRPISELNRLYARLYDASKDGAAAIGSIQANRIYLYDDGRRMGYAYLAGDDVVDNNDMERDFLFKENECPNK